MKVDIEKEIRDIIHFHCGGTYPKRQLATKLIIQAYRKRKWYNIFFDRLKNLKTKQ